MISKVCEGFNSGAEYFSCLKEYQSSSYVIIFIMIGNQGELLGPQSSTHEHLRSASQPLLDQRDLTTPTALQGVLEKVRGLRGWDIHGNREANERLFPDFDDHFRSAFEGALADLTEEKGAVTGMDLVRAYEQATVEAANTKQIASNMLHPSAYGRLIDHFGIPVLPKIIGQMAVKFPQAARRYKQQADKWASNNTAESSG